MRREAQAHSSGVPADMCQAANGRARRPPATHSRAEAVPADMVSHSSATQASNHHCNTCNQGQAPAACAGSLHHMCNRGASDELCMPCVLNTSSDHPAACLPHLLPLDPMSAASSCCPSWWWALDCG
jgi:hypothetical protein